ncbi:MAG: carboxypeptidase regulatory-like domain-containing protein [Elusimicrobia bacterium]|nr:carboxypeptidase regulatory-like domain-containing protein [Elusimicrobiota bacterium]
MHRTFTIIVSILLGSSVAQAANITGSVSYSGKVAKGGEIKFTADPKCAEQHKGEKVFAQDIVVNKGKLVNAFVYVKSGAPKGEAPKQAVVLEQKGCWYHPLVVPLHVNQPLEIVNNDPTMHNINVKPKNNSPFNIAQPVKGMKSTKQFAKPEVLIPVQCNVHPWMRSYLAVVDNPYYATTDDKGNFTIKGLPAGKYVVEVVHGKLGTTSKEVTVTDKDVNLPLTLGGSAPSNASEKKETSTKKS